MLQCRGGRLDGKGGLLISSYPKGEEFVDTFNLDYKCSIVVFFYETYVYIESGSMSLEISLLGRLRKFVESLFTRQPIYLFGLYRWMKIGRAMILPGAMHKHCGIGNAIKHQ
jgi:hypothetical protein